MLAAPAVAAPSNTSDAANPSSLFTVGTLTYTRRTLAAVFFWMLWGDLCLNVMESAIPRMVPLQLEALGASNAVIGLLTGSLFSLINWITNPIISTWSDRTRTRFGRRIPFLLIPTPFLALFLVGVGFSVDTAEYLRNVAPSAANAVAKTAAALLPDLHTLGGAAQASIGVMAVMLLLYKLADQFPQCVYYYMFPDVIPQKAMGKFVCFFRVMATLGGVIFHRYLLGASSTHPHAVYLGCAVLYLVAFLSMSLAVKEGAYPPPPPKAKGAVGGIGRWIRESYGIGFYWKYFLTYACSRWAFVPFNMFLIVYAQKALGQSADDFGHLMATVLALQLPVLLLLGPVVDKFHPMRVGLFGYAAMIVSGVAGFWFIRGEQSFLWLTIAAFIAITIYQSAIATLGPRLLPREKYGQFCSATMMVVESGMILLAWACGAMLDKIGVSYLFLWLAGFAALGLVLNVVLYFAWKAHGGDDHYTPPGSFDTVLMEPRGEHL